MLLLSLLLSAPGWRADTVFDRYRWEAAAIDRVCAPESATDGPALLKREGELSFTLSTGKEKTEQATELACVRALLHVSGALGRQGYQMPPGTSWWTGAVMTLLQAAKAKPLEGPGASLLGILAVEQPRSEQRALIRGALQASDRAVPGLPEVLQASALLARLNGQEAVSRAYTVRFLEAGGDSAWAELHLSRLAFADGDTTTGVRSFLSAISSARSAHAKTEIDWHVHWFLTPEEEGEWASLPDSGRLKWFKDAMARRDIRDGRPSGSRLAAHFERLNYVEDHFALRVPPNRTTALMRGPAFAFPAIELYWVITLDSIIPKTTAPLKRIKAPDDPNGASEPGDIAARPWREYNRWQVDFDDRGAVWMRFGAPERRIPWVGANNVREAWLYHVDGEVLLLNFEGEEFDGSAEATRLVTGVLGSYLCDVDAFRCGQTEWAKIGRLKPERLENVRHQDREYVQIATTRDDNSPHLDRSLTVTAGFNRVWDPKSTQEIALVPYAVDLRDLKSTVFDGNKVAELGLVVRQWDSARGERLDTALTRHLRLPATAPHDARVTGLIVTRSSSGVSAWGFTASQPDSAGGRVYDDHAIPLAADASGVGLSDLVLGSERQGINWESGSMRVLLSPLGAFDHKEEIHLYYQTLSANAVPKAVTTIAFRKLRADGKVVAPDFQIRFVLDLRQGLSEREQLLDVSKLKSGQYDLEVRVSLDSGGVLSQRHATILLK